ncbi:hypothetical protein ACFL1H_07025 [Nanoarchaeota archaeon]
MAEDILPTEREKTEEEKKDEMAEGVRDDNIYEEEGRDEQVDSDQITDVEEGFMAGADQDGEGAKCRVCGKILIEAEDVIEREINGENLRFCSAEHAEKYASENEGKSEYDAEEREIDADTDEQERASEEE